MRDDLLPNCPECGGARLIGDPSGLRIQHRLDCSIIAAEDATLAADRQRGIEFERPMTETERLLLITAGATVPTEAERLLLIAAGKRNVPGVPTTSVRWLTEGFRRREWLNVAWPQTNDDEENTNA